MKKTIIILVTILSLSGCNNSNHLSDAYGNFEAKEIIVSAEASGKLLSLKLVEGQTVKENELVGIIDTIQLVLKKEQLLAQKEMINAKYQNVNMQIEVQEEQKNTLLNEKNRVENLLKDGAATTKQMDDINSQLNIIDKQIKTAKTQYSLINAEKQNVEAQMEQLNDQINKCYLRNPKKGTVLELYVEESELVNMGRNLYKLADMTTMDLRVYISGDQLSHIQIGQKVDVLYDENKKENNKLEGTISWISSSAEFTPKIIQTKEERVKLVYAVIVKVKNDGSLKIGMPGEVVFAKSKK